MAMAIAVRWSIDLDCSKPDTYFVRVCSVFNQKKMTTDASTATTTKALEWEDIANGEFWGRQLQELLDTAYNVALKAIYALFILLVGWILIKIVIWAIGKLFNRLKMDVAVKSFLLSLIKFFLWMILWLQIFKIAEIPNTSFTAVSAPLPITSDRADHRRSSPITPIMRNRFSFFFFFSTTNKRSCPPLPLRSAWR
jgi:hypothetical protein